MRVDVQLHTARTDASDVVLQLQHLHIHGGNLDLGSSEEVRHTFDDGINLSIWNRDDGATNTC